MRHEFFFEQAPADAGRPRVRVLIRTVGGEYPWAAQVVVASDPGDTVQRHRPRMAVPASTASHSMPPFPTNDGGALDRLYRQILADPDDIGLRLRYADAAAGNLRYVGVDSDLRLNPVPGYDYDGSLVYVTPPILGPRLAERYDRPWLRWESTFAREFKWHPEYDEV